MKGSSLGPSLTTRVNAAQRSRTPPRDVSAQDGSSTRLTDFVGDHMLVNSAAAALAPLFASWLGRNSTHLMPAQEAPLTEACSREANRMPSRLPEVMDALRNVTLCSEWCAAFTVEKQSAGAAGPHVDGTEELVVRVLGVTGLERAVTEQKKRLGWDLCDFTLGSADTVANDALLQNLTEIPLTYTYEAEAAALRRQLDTPDTLRTFLQDAIRLLTEVRTLKVLPKTGDPLPCQLVRHVKSLIDSRRQGSSALAAVEALAAANAAASAPHPLSPPTKSSSLIRAVQAPALWNAYGWRLWVTVCEHMMAPVLRGSDFSDAMALCVVELWTLSSRFLQDAAPPRSENDHLVLHHLTNYAERRLSSLHSCATPSSVLLALVGELDGAAPTGVPALAERGVAVGERRPTVGTSAKTVHHADAPSRAESGGLPAMKSIAPQTCASLYEKATTQTSIQIRGGTVAVLAAAKALHAEVASPNRSEGRKGDAAGRPRGAGGPSAAPENQQPIDFAMESIVASFLNDARRLESDSAVADFDSLSASEGHVSLYVDKARAAREVSLAAGCAWHSEESIRFAAAVFHIITAVKASRLLRQLHPSLEGFTLVPARKLCEPLLAASMALSTDLKHCVLCLETVLRRDELHRRNLFQGIGDALTCLWHDTAAAEAARSRAKVWESWAASIAERSCDKLLQKQEEYDALCRELDERCAARESCDEACNDNELRIAQLKLAIARVKSHNFTAVWVPFRTPAQVMAWSIPETVRTLAAFGEMAHDYLAEKPIAEPCGHMCSFHSPALNRGLRPGPLRHCAVPAWIHLDGVCKHRQTLPFTAFNPRRDASQFVSKPTNSVPSCPTADKHTTRFCHAKFATSPTALPIPPPLLRHASPATPAETARRLALYATVFAPHPTAALEARQASRRENQSYCTPPLHHSLSPQEWVQLYSIRSHRETQVSRLLVALRGGCARAVGLFETDYVVQHYLVTLLSDAHAFEEVDAQAAMAQLPVLEEDIPACTVRHAPLLLFLSAVYATCHDGDRCRDVVLACAQRSLVLAQQLRQRCERAHVGGSEGTDSADAVAADDRAMNRVASIGLACVGFAPIRLATASPFRESVLPAAVALALHRGLAQQMCGSACTSPYDTLARSGLFVVMMLLLGVCAAVQHGSLSAGVAGTYPRLCEAASITWDALDQRSLVASGHLSQPRQTCTVDLATGTLFLDGRTVGGLPHSVLQGGLYQTLFGAGTQMRVHPARLAAWYESATGCSLGPDRGGETTRFVFSDAGDVGLNVRGEGYRLTALVSPAPVHADVGIERHFHFVGVYATDDGATRLDVILFKPMPPGSEGTAVPWLSWHAGRCDVHFIAARPSAAAASAPFTLYAVPYSQRAAPLSASLLAHLARWDTVVTEPAQLAALAQLFPTPLVTSQELLVTAPSEQQRRRGGQSAPEEMAVTVAIPRMGQSFLLTPTDVCTRRGYRLADPSASVPWLRPPPAPRDGSGGAPFLLLWRSASAATTPVEAMRAEEVVVWPSSAGPAQAAQWAVTEVWRHAHFRYLQARTTAERLRLCALLLTHYPPTFHLSVDPADGGLTVLEEVCVLLSCCVGNRPWSAHEATAFEELRVACDALQAFDHRAPLLVWLDRLRAVRHETEALALAAEGGHASVPPPPRYEEVPGTEALLLRHAEDHVRRLLMRRLLPHRCVPPPELLLGSALEHVHPLPVARPAVGAAASVEAPVASLREAQRAVAEVLRQSSEWASLLAGAGGDAGAVEGSVRRACAVVAGVRATLPTVVAALATAGRGALSRAGRADPLASLGLQEVGHVAVSGAARWLREVAPWDGELARAPPLPPEAADALTAVCCAYLEACALQDWLTRVSVLLRARDSDSAAQGQRRVEAALAELGSPRGDIRQHPAWLVFEAEQRLAIRYVQFATWKAMWSGATGPAASPATPGLVTQLNMGEGKTRVVIPMLLLSELEERRAGRRDTPCVHALSAVAEELRRHLQDTLGSPSLRVRVLHKPFARSVAATRETVRALLGSFRRFPRAVLVEQREHYVSFMQKREEVLLERGGADDADGLAPTRAAASRAATVVPPTPAQLLGADALHVFDEADELLSCRYNLVYSVGAETRLAERELRCAIAERLLACCAQLIVAFPEHFEFTDPARAAAMQVGLLQVEYPPCYAKQSADMGGFCDEVLHYFLQAPPPLCTWMARLPAAVHHLVTTASDVTEGSFSVLGSPQPDMVAQVMCLRGFFQHGVLRLVLGHRANVSFGVPPPWRTTKMAVPYEAADQPSERSEFAQPEVALTLTYLAYMQRGLSPAEFREALGLLLRLPDAQRDGEYEKWCAVEGGCCGEADGVPTNAAMVDAQDAAMVSAMCAALRRRMAVVAFWVFHFVLEAEGRYHSHMLRATAWDIASQRRMVGFSGTKDGCALLPATLAFRDHPDSRIAGSTERMSELIRQHAGQHMLHLAGDERPQDQQLVLCAVHVGKCDVLIDVGALLAGASPRAVARFACAQLETDTGDASARRRGVCFFDYVDERCWVIMDVATQRVLPLETSPLAPSECFVVFDQARCRGADLKLRDDAKALVSLARGTHRDVLLQAVGRLRAFGRNQTIEFVATESVAEEIGRAGAAGPVAARVLLWAERNTEEALSHAIPEYVGAAAHHLAKTALDAAHVHTVRTPTTCHALYRRGFGKVACRDFAAGSLAAFASSVEAQQVVERLTRLAGDVLVPTASAGTTTERELEQESEREREKEREREVAQTVPFKEPATTQLGTGGGQEVSRWCERALCVPGFASMRTGGMSFAVHFHHVWNAVDAASGAVDLSKASPPLRRICYALVSSPPTSVTFLTQYQAAVLLHTHRGGLHVDHSYTPFVFLAFASPASRRKPLHDFLRDAGDAVAAFAHFYNGETHFAARLLEPLRGLLWAPVCALTERDREPARPSEEVEHPGDEPPATAEPLFFFHRCRGTLSLLPGSVLEEVYFELLHEAALTRRGRAQGRG